MGGKSTGENGILRLILTLAIAAVLTIVTQLGGIAWLLARYFRFRKIAFVLLYAGLSFSSLWIAPIFGRVPLACGGEGTLRAQSWHYCLLNRQYVSPGLKDVAQDLANRVAEEYPGTITLTLDANFPFFDGFALLPHLSHNDGRKLDLAFYYRDGATYIPGAVRSPIGYFAFEDGPTNCPARRLTLRWDLRWLQPFMIDLELEAARTQFMLKLLADDVRVGRVFLEPHLKNRLAPEADKIRFQGCRAARHDDHIHIEL